MLCSELKDLFISVTFRLDKLVLIGSNKIEGICAEIQKVNILVNLSSDPEWTHFKFIYIDRAR